MTFEREQRTHFIFRLEVFCRELGISAADLATRIEAGDRLLTLRLAEVASTNHTYFFREPETFAFLIDRILPSLPSGPLRFWSAAASSGDEAYSLAITALEVFGGAASRVSILGTDISDRQIKTAELGVYPEAQLAAFDETRKARWFKPNAGGHFTIAPDLRALCTFRRFNLTVRPWPFQQRFHVTFLRNVLYYFDAATRHRIVEECFDVTEPGGWLVTSLTEPMHDLTTRWSAIRPGIHRRGGT
jgi:chemotaxis protein methyltransferase CheR